ncbi:MULTISPECIES: hypothetical protein [unclassified Micromonospora]
MPQVHHDFVSGIELDRHPPARDAALRTSGGAFRKASSGSR